MQFGTKLMRCPVFPTDIIQIVWVAGLQNFDVRCSFRNGRHEVIVRRFAVFLAPLNLVRLEIANDVHACVVLALAHTALVQFRCRIQLVVASGRPTNPIHAFIETVMAARGAVLHLIAEQKVVVRFDDATVQFAFIVRRLAIFWHPFHIRAQTLNVEIVVVHVGALFFTEIERVQRTVLCVARTILDSCPNTVFAAIRGCRRIAFARRRLYATATRSGALIISARKRCVHRIEIPIPKWFQLTASRHPNHHRFWPKPFDSVVHICHADTSDSSGIRCHRPTAYAAFDILRYRYHTRADRTAAANIFFLQSIRLLHWCLWLLKNEMNSPCTSILSTQHRKPIRTVDWPRTFLQQAIVASKMVRSCHAVACSTYRIHDCVCHLR